MTDQDANRPRWYVITSWDWDRNELHIERLAAYDAADALTQWTIQRCGVMKWSNATRKMEPILSEPSHIEPDGLPL